MTAAAPSTAPPSAARSWASSPGTTTATACASRGSACFPTVCPGPPMFRPTAIAGWRRSSVLQSIDSLLTDGRKVSAGLIRSGQPIVVLVQEDPALRRALRLRPSPGVGGPARPGVATDIDGCPACGGRLRIRSRPNRSRFDPDLSGGGRAAGGAPPRAPPQPQFEFAA